MQSIDCIGAGAEVLTGLALAGVGLTTSVSGFSAPVSVPAAVAGATLTLKGVADVDAYCGPERKAPNYQPIVDGTKAVLGKVANAVGGEQMRAISDQTVDLLVAPGVAAGAGYAATRVAGKQTMDYLGHKEAEKLIRKYNLDVPPPAQPLRNPTEAAAEKLAQQFDRARRRHPEAEALFSESRTLGTVVRGADGSFSQTGNVSHVTAAVNGSIDMRTGRIARTIEERFAHMDATNKAAMQTIGHQSRNLDNYIKAAEKLRPGQALTPREHELVSKYVGMRDQTWAQAYAEKIKTAVKATEGK